MTEKDKKSVVKATTSSYKRMTPKQWAEADALWASGEVTLAQLRKRFGKSNKSFTDRFEKLGIKKGEGAKAHAEKVKEEVTKASVEDATIMAARIKETKEEHYKMASGLAKLTWAEILRTKQDGVPIGTALTNLKALDSAMTVLKKAREERYAVLGLDRADAVDENEVPELVISELTAEQITALQERSFSELDELDTMQVIDATTGEEEEIIEVVEES